jgi:hypothetical protein
MNNKEGLTLDGRTGKVIEMGVVKKVRYRAKLDSISDVKREMTKLYRETRSGLVDVQDATKLTWCLQAVAKVIETSDLEERVKKLEHRDE